MAQSSGSGLFFFKTQIKTSVQRMTITVAELTVLIVTAFVRMMVNHRKFCSSASSQEERNNETVTTPLAEVSCSSSSFLSKSEANFVSPQPRDCHRYFLVPEAIHCQQFGAGGYTICRCSFNTWISGPVIPHWQRLKVSEFVSKMKIGLAPVGLYLQSKDRSRRLRLTGPHFTPAMRPLRRASCSCENY